MDVLDEFIVFMTESIPRLNDYYRGISTVPPNYDFDRLKYLINKFNDSIEYLKNNVENISDVEYLDKLNISLSSLYFVVNLSRWLRSSKGLLSLYYYSGQIYTLGQNDGGSPIINDKDFSFFFNNDLVELDYDLTAGKKVVLNNELNDVGRPLNSIVDFSDTLNKAGSDILNDFSFDSIENDIKFVEGFDCSKQQIENMINLIEGDLLSYPNLSLSFKNSIGSSRNSLNLPIVFRMLESLIATDDYFLNFYVNEAKFEQDNLKIDILFNTVDGYQLSQTI